MTKQTIIVLTNEELELIEQARDFFYNFSLACGDFCNVDDNGAWPIYERIQDFFDGLKENSFISETGRVE